MFWAPDDLCKHLLWYELVNYVHTIFKNKNGTINIWNIYTYIRHCCFVDFLSFADWSVQEISSPDLTCGVCLSVSKGGTKWGHWSWGTLITYRGSGCDINPQCARHISGQFPTIKFLFHLPMASRASPTLHTGRLLWIDSKLPCSASNNSTVEVGVILTPSVTDTSLAQPPRPEFHLHGENPGDKSAGGAVHGTVHGVNPGDSLQVEPWTARFQQTSHQVEPWTAAPSTVPYTARIQETGLPVKLCTAAAPLYTVPYTGRNQKIHFPAEPCTAATSMVPYRRESSNLIHNHPTVHSAIHGTVHGQRSR